MNSCPIDHTPKDVQKKLAEQQPFLPQELYQKCQQFLEEERDQNTLNDLFHLLKKYDLATAEVKVGRQTALQQLLMK